MTETRQSDETGQSALGGPPAFLIARATRRAEALGMCVYLYPVDQTWIMTTHPGQLPATTEVWEIPANRNEQARRTPSRR